MKTQIMALSSVSSLCIVAACTGDYNVLCVVCHVCVCVLG